MRLIEIEKQYLEAYKSQSVQLKKIFNETKNNYSLNLNSNELTLCLIQRLAIYYETQNTIKEFLNKRYAAPAADFFVESVLFFLRLALEIFGSKLEAHSERQIRPEKNAIRPDISIWDNGKVVSIIECKTQLGWNRSNWKINFEKREEILKNNFPNANAYLLVMTGSNWGGFSEENFSSGKYYCILKDKWPLEAYNNMDINDILTPVEDLFKVLLNLK